MNILLTRLLGRRGGVVVVAAFVGVALSGRSWQSFGFDAGQTRLNPEGTAPSTLTKRWAAPLGGQVRSTPAVVDGVVYVGNDNDTVHALYAATGANVWTFTTGGIVDSSPAVDSGLVYVGSADGTLYALKAPSGALEWSFKTGGPIEGAPTV